MGVGALDEGVQDSHPVSVSEDLHLSVGQRARTRCLLIFGGAAKSHAACRAADLG
jgi:hypothetical protein